jgi:hypothetical protein
VASLFTILPSSGADGDSITTGNTGATTIVGTVTDVEIDTSWSLVGTRSFYINNVAVSGYANWTESSHNLQCVRC